MSDPVLSRILGNTIELTSSTVDQAAPLSTETAATQPFASPNTAQTANPTATAALPANGQATATYRDDVEWVLQKFQWVLHPLALWLLANALALAVGLVGQHSSIVGDSGWQIAMLILVLAWFASFGCLGYVGYTHNNTPFDKSLGAYANSIQFLVSLIIVAAVLGIFLAIYSALTHVSLSEAIEKFWPIKTTWIPLVTTAYFEITYLLHYMVKRDNTYNRVQREMV